MRSLQEYLLPYSEVCGQAKYPDLMPAFVPACLFACLPAHLPACPPACLPSCLSAFFLSASCLPASLPSFCLPACLPGCQVVFDNVSKSYAKGPASRDHAPALSQLSQRIYAGECFALLGANGAGKTTAIKILTGEVQPDTGDAFVAGYSVTQQLAAAQHCIGYSPQFEALTPGLSGRELLLLYAALRGVKCEQQAAQMAQQLLQALGLEGLADVPCGAYSGGNKARLSVAVALVAQPQLVVLDEPSTGMDAAARHALWKVLQVGRQAGSGTCIVGDCSVAYCE